MKQKSFIAFGLLPVSLLLFIACGKDDASKPNSSGELYIATPEKMMNLAGSLWSTARPQLDDKKGYWYTDFTGNTTNIPFHAAVSLPAVEETDKSIGYIISFNTSLDVETVGGVELGTDTLTLLTFDQAKGLMLEYYNRSLPYTGDTIYTAAGYTLPGEPNGTGSRRSTVTEAVDMLNRGVVEDSYSVEVNGKEGSFHLHMAKYPDGKSYYFICQTF